MITHTKLFIKIEDYYADLVAQLDKAYNCISMTSTFHAVYDYLRQFSSGKNMADFSHLDPSGLWIGDVHIMLTIPGLLADIRWTLLHLIHNADKALYVRTWYFLPDDEILNALCAQAERGVRVNVLLSHRTRVPLIDAANYRHAHRLASSGGHVYRYTGQYMHAKLAWNDRGEVLLGSANLDSRSMNGNFEICVWLPDHNLAKELRLAYEADLASSFRQSPEIYQRRSLPGKLLTLSCNLISPWL